MKTSTIVLIVLLGGLLLIGGCGCNGYNSMVKNDETVNAMWGNVQSEYQRRLDLIDNLVNTVKGAANFEKETLVQVQEARSKATSIQIDPSKITPEQLEAFQRAQAGVGSALKGLLAVAEAYPDLKATQNFRDLQVQLEGTENRIKVARNDFNESVREYNTTVRRFPNNIWATMFGFSAKASFKADEGAEKAPKVSF